MSIPELLTASALAHRAGVSPTTLLKWTSWPHEPLGTTTLPTGQVRFSEAELLNFCDAHPELRAAATARRHLSPVDAPSRTVGTAGGSVPDVLTAQAAMRDLKTAVDAAVTAVARSAALAREVAIAHEEVIGSLLVALRAYDSALTSVTAPEHGPS